MREFPAFRDAARETQLVDQPAAQFYGAGYADMQNRTPSIEKITNLLGWRPKVSLREAVRLTLAAMVPND